MTLSVISNSPTAVSLTSREIVVAMVLKFLKETESFLEISSQEDEGKKLILVRALVRRLFEPSSSGCE